MGELLSRFRYPLTYAFLALASALSMSGQAGSEGMGLGSRAVLELTLPFQQMVTLPVEKVRGVFQRYVLLVGLVDENEHLRSEVARLIEENTQYREAVVSAKRFDELEDLRQRLDLKMVPANVAAQDLSAWFQSVVVDQGESAGIRPGMPVMAEGGGVVGVVSGVSPNAAKVLLISDAQSHVDAYVQRSRARGSVSGGGDRDCQFDFVLRGADVHDGDLLLTSGLGGVYPRGLILGTAKAVERASYGLFQRATVSPFVDFRQLEEVFVIVEQRHVPAPSAFDSDDDGLWVGPEE